MWRQFFAHNAGLRLALRVVGRAEREARVQLVLHQLKIAHPADRPERTPAPASPSKGAGPRALPSRTERALLTMEQPAGRLIPMIDDLAAARAIHVLAVVHWIGGMAAVTTIVLPYARRLPDANAAMSSFETFERRFARQARVSVLLTGISGLYMLWRLAAWERFESPSFWWLHLMVALWIVFVLMLFVVEPLGMDRLFRSYALREKDHAFVIATRLHWAALLVAALTIGAGVLGAHGYLP